MSEAPSQIPPERFFVSVLMERRDRTDSRWLKESWDLLGVVQETQAVAAIETAAATETGATGVAPCRRILTTEHSEQYLWSGFEVRLYRDELESYYHNLLAPEPKIFVITHAGADGRPDPFLVSLSYDQAAAYEASGEGVYHARLPPVLYAWVEHYVVENYAPQRRIKRKRDSWKDKKA